MVCWDIDFVWHSGLSRAGRHFSPQGIRSPFERNGDWSRFPRIRLTWFYFGNFLWLHFPKFQSRSQWMKRLELELFSQTCLLLCGGFFASNKLLQPFYQSFTCTSAARTCKFICHSMPSSDCVQAFDRLVGSEISVTWAAATRSLAPHFEYEAKLLQHLYRIISIYFG